MNIQLRLAHCHDILWATFFLYLECNLIYNSKRRAVLEGATLIKFIFTDFKVKRHIML